MTSVSSPTDHQPPPEPAETPAPEPRPSRDRGAVAVLLTTAGALLAVLMAALSAVLELQLISLRVGGQLIGVSALLALVGNLFIGRFAYRATRHKWAVFPPALVWLAITLIAAGRTTEGDYLIASNNWVGWAMIGLGSLAWTIVGIRLVSSSPAKTTARTLY
ncbi:hypothetical protein SAMN05421812_103521 [Asanoa hainanensis]|uniref:Uncharacterized protein n=1 Tax=Asanoa hainanensis TaxID=560556 RepID=A0A239KHS8_9ACTN|nr:hypothetical protein SAMN05421812_103521 [Asanoa hainanensis]